jgi:hypothetical protein
MADLTTNEIGKVLQLNLVNVDTTQSPPVQSPLNLSSATQVQLSFCLADQNEKPKAPSRTVPMTIVNPVGGIVQYAFATNDLAKPGDMGKYGVFRYSVQVTFSNGTILVSAFDGKLTVKDDSQL